MFLSFLHILIVPGGIADPYGLISPYSHLLYNSRPGIFAIADGGNAAFLSAVLSIPTGLSVSGAAQVLP